MPEKTKSKKNIKSAGNTKNAKNDKTGTKGVKSSKIKPDGNIDKTRKTVQDEKRKRNMIGIGMIVLIILLVAASVYWIRSRAPGAAQTVTMLTTKGDITIEVYPEKMPVTVANFEKLVKSNFYNGLTFHRVEGWVIQGGDPKGNGTGGPGWTIPLETSKDLKNKRGAVAMARSQDPDSAGSQFYILKRDASQLDGQYAVFGMVTKGMDVVDQIQAGDKMEIVKW